MLSVPAPEMVGGPEVSPEFAHIAAAWTCSAPTQGRVRQRLPFDPEEGPMFIAEGMRSIESMQLAEDDKCKVYFGNAIGLLGIPAPAGNK